MIYGQRKRLSLGLGQGLGVNFGNLKAQPNFLHTSSNKAMHL